MTVRRRIVLACNVSVIAIASGCIGDTPIATPATDVSTLPSTTQPEYITRAYAEANGGLRQCGPLVVLSPKDMDAYNEGTTTVPIEQRSYTLKHLEAVRQSLSHSPIDEAAEVRINFHDTEDDYINLGVIIPGGSASGRELEIFDNYRLPPPLEMYCFGAPAGALITDD